MINITPPVLYLSIILIVMILLRLLLTLIHSNKLLKITRSKLNWLIEDTVSAKLKVIFDTDKVLSKYKLKTNHAKIDKEFKERICVICIYSDIPEISSFNLTIAVDKNDYSYIIDINRDLEYDDWYQRLCKYLAKYEKISA